RSMADASIDARLPTVDNTLQALNTLREEQTRGFGSTPEADTQNGAATNNGTGPGESAEPEFDSGADTAPESGNGACPDAAADADRKSTRLNSSHVKISYAVVCLKKKS